MVNDYGTTVPGALTPDRKGWHPTEQLGYGRTYTMTVSARGPRGMPYPPNVQLHHLVARQPDRRLPEHRRRLPDPGRQFLRRRHHRRRAYFDDPITDKTAAEKRLHVTASPPVAGSWNWIDDQTRTGDPRNIGRQHFR